MKVTAILNGVKVTKEIPTSWDQVTYGNFLKLTECGTDIAKIVSLFTGIDIDTLRKSKILNIEAVTGALSFLNVPMDALDIPDKVLGYDIPKNLEFESMGQYADIQDAIKKAEGKDKEMKQIIDHGKKTYYFSESTPNVITNTMTTSKPGFYTPEKYLKERGYTNLGKSLEMLRQMGKVIDF